MMQGLQKQYCHNGKKCGCGGIFRPLMRATPDGREVFQCMQCGDIEYGPK